MLYRIHGHSLEIKELPNNLEIENLRNKSHAKMCIHNLCFAQK